VLANLEILQAELEGEQEETVEAALRSTQRMRRLVADLLFLANADAGRETPHEVVDLGLVVRDAAAETAPITSTHQVRVEAPTGIYVSGAADDLHRLVVNLIQNAVNHTPAGTVVRVRLRRRDSAMRPTADEAEAAVLEISDNGPGIPIETRDRIFERFVRAPNALANESARGGSGLGLAIVNAVAIAHGGNVKLTDSPDGGARFVIRIPTTTRSAGATTAPAPEAKEPAQTSTTTGSTRGRLFKRS
jgi:signal transduction histidine kinase